jgi:aldose 1-epimerase
VSEQETVRLRDAECGIEATFLPGAGLICCSLRDRDEELLAQNSGVTAYVERGTTMGIPLLYPWANRLAGFRYSVGERVVSVPHDPALVATDEHELPIHGVIGGRLPWQLEDAGEHTLEARLSWDESDQARFAVFPFRHEVLYSARLAGARLEVEVAVHASRGEVVPVAFGFHPYLSLPHTPRERWIVELPPMRRVTLDADQIPLAPGESLPRQRFELAAREFDDGFDRVAEPASFAVSAGARRLAVEFREGYRCAQVFAPAASLFICFEPMTAPTNALCSGQLHLLAPGTRYVAAFAVSVEAPR